MGQALLLILIFLAWFAAFYLFAASLFFLRGERWRWPWRRMPGFVTSALLVSVLLLTVKLIQVLGKWGLLAPLLMVTGVAVGFFAVYFSGPLLRRMRLPSKLVSKGSEPYRSQRVRIVWAETVTERIHVFLWDSFIHEPPALEDPVASSATKT
ncbi:MAG: hypothetical protein WC641_03215 [Patescibacteria group bacterium]